MTKEITTLDDLRILINSKVKAQKQAEETANKIKDILVNNLVGKYILEVDESNYHTYLKVSSIEVDIDLHLSVKGVAVEHSEDYIDLGVWTSTHYYSYKDFYKLKMISQAEYEEAWVKVTELLSKKADEKCD